MDEEETYFPDFSDIYNDNFQFWDFMSHKEESVKCCFDEVSHREELYDKNPVPPVTNKVGTSDFQGSQTFWDFLSSKTVQNSTELHQTENSDIDNFNEFSNSSVDKNRLPWTSDIPSASDEFWDFLKTSTENDSIEEHRDVPLFSDSRQAILPRITSVFSLSNNETIHPSITYTDPTKVRDVIEVCNVTDKIKLKTISNVEEGQRKTSETHEESLVKEASEKTLQSSSLSKEDPTYILQPSDGTLKIPNCSQCIIIVNNGVASNHQKQISNTYLDEVIRNHKQNTNQNDFQVSPTRCTNGIGDFDRDLRLVGFRNNHVLNTCRKKKRSLQSPPTKSKYRSSFDGGILNSISTDPNTVRYDANKQIDRTFDSIQRKPIKCIPLGRCKNAIQQMNNPISLDAYETNAESCSAEFSDLSTNNISVKTSSIINYRQMNPPLITIPNRGHSTIDLAPHRATEVPYRVLLLPISSSNVTKMHQKTILPKPPSLQVGYKRAPKKERKCRRKTVKELLQERQQLKGTDIASEATQNTISLSDKPAEVNIASFRCDSKSSPSSCKAPLRPRHYDMSELQIGLLKIQEDACGRFRSKFKVLFMKRQFLYDFPVLLCNQPSLKRVGEDDIARIAIPFNNISSLSLKDHMIYLNVNSPPHLSFGNSHHESRYMEDSWRNFLHNSLNHKVVLRKRQANKLKSLLCEFDKRFIALLNIVPRVNQLTYGRDSSSPLSFKNRFSKNRKCVMRRLPDDLLLNQMCSCRTSCRSIRCSCVKAARSCSSATCHCINCNNPLNVLETIGLDIHFSLKDTCLFQNIYQIPDLPNFLLNEVRLDCCNCLVRVQDCIPGTVLCPNINCSTTIEYSWCHKIVSYPERNPRNHCSFCGQCCFSNGRHCHVCKKCYAVTSKSNKCPTCLEEKRLCPPRNLNTICYDKNMCRSSSKPQIILLDSSSLKTNTETLPPNH